MGAGALATDHVIVRYLDQDSVRFDMKVAMRLRFALERMIVEFTRDGTPLDKQPDDVSQFAHSLALPLGKRSI